jgi:15-cis-phytoene synthase
MPTITDRRVSNVEALALPVNCPKQDNTDLLGADTCHKAPPADPLTALNALPSSSANQSAPPAHASQPSLLPRPGSSLGLAVRFAPKGKQPQLLAWVRWWHEISQIVYSVSDPTVADRKLAWWAQAVIDGFKQTPQHPLLQALTGSDGLLQAPALPLWLSQIEGQQTLTGQTRWLDMPTLERHALFTTGAACEGAAWLVGARSTEALALARQMGLGLRLAHILERLGQDTRLGWLHIPIDILQEHGVRAHELLKPEIPPVSGMPVPSHPAIQALLSGWHQRSQSLIHEALRQAQQLPKNEREALSPLAVLCKLHLHLLDDLAAAAYPVLHQRMLLGPWRKQWLAHKARWSWR